MIQNNNLQFVLDSILTETGIELNDITAADHSTAAATLLKQELSKLQSQALLTDADGVVKFEDLEVCVYLVVGPEGMDAFLIFLPMSATTEWFFDVVAKPKLDERPPYVSLYFPSVRVGQ